MRQSSAQTSSSGKQSGGSGGSTIPPECRSLPKAETTVEVLLVELIRSVDRLADSVRPVKKPTAARKSKV